MTTIHEPQNGTTHSVVDGPQRTADPRDSGPVRRLQWTDPVTGATGFLVLHTLVSGLATGGTRMRQGCTMGEVEDLARAMALKTSAFDLPVGGAKAGIDFDPKDPRATEVLERFYSEMRPWLDAHWVTAEDLGIAQHQLDEVFAQLGLEQSYHAAIRRSWNPSRTLLRVRDGLNTPVEGERLLSDVIGGYGVAQACLGVANTWSWNAAATSVAVQGIGTMGGGTAWYLHEAGMRVVAIADAAGTLYSEAGLDVPALLDLRDEYGEIDRSRLPAGVEQLPREAVMSTEAEIFVPAAVSYAIQPDNEADISAMVIVEAANSSTIPEAETMLAARGVPVIPDFVANAGAAAWAWWLLLGEVGTDPADSFARLRTEMQDKVSLMLAQWDSSRTPPRRTAGQFATENARTRTNRLVTIP